MKIKSYTHIGKKEVNEDSLAINSNCMIVCDGVGGATKGGIASSSIINSIVGNSQDSNISVEKLNALFEKAQSKLNLMVEENPRLDGMASTVASVFLTDDGIYTCHAGDSRIYFVKQSSNKFWQTWDHSVVGKLVQTNEINREEARVHPMNNQIFKAFKGNLDRKTIEPEIHFLSDIESGDICFICSDGVSEAFSDLDLLELLSTPEQSIDEKLRCIKERCIRESNDNHSAIICEFELNDIDKFSGFSSSWSSISSLRN